MNIKLNADQLRRYEIPEDHAQLKNSLKKNEIYIVLDNVLDTYNIGSVFRLADAVAAKELYLCGGSETPPNHRIKKASINTTEWVEWKYFENTVEAIADLRSSVPEIQVVAVELTDSAIDYDKFEYKLPVALVVGHESFGVSEEVLESCDAVVKLPMFGVNVSLNVMVSLGITLYEVLEKTAI